MSEKQSLSVKTIYSVVAAVVFLFATYHGLNSYIDRRIEAKTNDPKFILELTKNIRPSLIFDAKGTIHADMGASAYIKKIEVNKNGEKDSDESVKVIITPHKHMPYPPIIESIDSNLFEQISKRGNGHQWICEMEWCGGGSDLPRFRLEIINTN